MFERECKLRELVTRHLNLVYDGEHFFNAETNEVYDPYIPTYIELPEEIEHDGDWIDDVLFFGDGTIEFHLMNEQDAYCWEQFPIEIIDRVNEGLARTLHYDIMNFNTK